MADRDLRLLERAAAGGDPAAVDALRRERERTRVPASELLEGVVRLLGREDETPFGPCSVPNSVRPNCVRHHGQSAPQDNYCWSCWAYVLACRLQTMCLQAEREQRDKLNPWGHRG